MPQLTQGFGFDLPHPLPGHVELPAQLFQRTGTPVLQPEAQGDHPLFPGRQALEHIHQLPAEQLPPGLVGGDACLIVLDEVLEVGVLFLPHRRLEADGVLSQLYQLPHPGGLHVQLGGDLLGGQAQHVGGGRHGDAVLAVLRDEDQRRTGRGVLGREEGLGVDAVGGELLPEDIAESCRKAGILKDTAPAFSDTSESLPSRSPLLCSGCPHRSTFYHLSQMKLPVAGDIGCYNLGTLPPFNAQHTMGSMGASVGVLHGMGLSGLPEPAVCTIGDGTFFHAGVAPLLNMVHNKGKGTVIIMDNRTTAMTGHQDNPGLSKTLSNGTIEPVDIAGLCRACGVEKVLTADAFDLAAVRKALEECTAYDGVSVLITRGDCVFVSRSPKPARVVDADKCIACGKCIQSGCPSVVLSDEKHPKTGKRKARIEPVTCVGCGICAQVCPFGAITVKEGGEA